MDKREFLGVQSDEPRQGENRVIRVFLCTGKEWGTQRTWIEAYLQIPEHHSAKGVCRVDLFIDYK